MKMLWVWFVLALLVVFPGVLSAESPPAFGFDFGANGKYVWRGMVYNSQSTLWSDAWISWKGFTATLYGSMDLTDVKGEQWKVTDVLIFLDYSRSFGTWNFSVGYNHYMYPGYGGFFPTTGELSGKAGSDFGLFQASLTAYVDIIEVKGLYLSPQIERSFTFDNVTSLLSASLGFADKKYNLYYFSAEKSGFTDLTLRLGITVSPKGSLGNFMIFNGNLNYSKILDKALAEAFEDDSNFWWGIGVSLFF